MIDARELPIVLTDEELKQVTHYSTVSKIKDALKKMGIPFKERPDGSPTVSRLAYEQAMGIKLNLKARKPELR